MAQVVRLNALRPDVVAHVSFKFRLHACRVVRDLPSANGSSWTKWTATVLSEHGETAAVICRFLGPNQAVEVEQWGKKFPEGSTYVCNPEKKKNCGFKGSKSNAKYTACSSPASLEFVSTTVLQPLKDESIPPRPACHLSIMQILEKDTECRVDLVGVISHVTPALEKDCKIKGQSMKREVSKVRLLDDSGADAEISLWGSTLANAFTSNDVGIVVSFYSLKLSVWKDTRALSSVEDTFIQRLSKADNVSEREDKNHQ